MEVRLYRCGVVRDISTPGDTISSPQDVAGIVQKLIGRSDRECFVCIHLNARLRVTGAEVVSVGCLDHTLVHPREVFKGAIKRSAHAIIIAHNHPSGEIDPSMDDRKLTVRMAQVGKLLGIDVLDHLIVGGRKCFSFRRDAGMTEGLS